MDIQKIGQERANPLANSTNNLRVIDKDAGNASEDYVKNTSIADSVTVTGIDISGTPYLFPAAVAVTSPAAVRAAIADVLEVYEVSPRVEFQYTAATTTLEFSHVGGLTVSALVLSTGDLSTTRYSTVIHEIEHTLAVVGAVANINDGTTSEALSTGTYAWSGTPATDATTAATLASEIETELDDLSVYYRKVTVTANDVTEKYDVSIIGESGVTLFLPAGSPMARASLSEGYFKRA